MFLNICTIFFVSWLLLLSYLRSTLCGQVVGRGIFIFLMNQLYLYFLKYFICLLVPLKAAKCTSMVIVYSHDDFNICFLTIMSELYLSCIVSPYNVQKPLLSLKEITIKKYLLYLFVFSSLPFLSCHAIIM